ncbi:MAG: hypothetical protein DMF69_18600 [Acidobacteria bacterium]|nr:MAG: hypothetical protein DMF69_18600 [Acidobacteriota bacterium]
MREPASQGANCIALILGGIAILAPQLNPLFRYVFINFLIVGAILAFLWPERSWRWGLWMAIPVVTLGVINFANSMSVGALQGTLIVTAQAFLAGALMGWLGSRFSPRRLPYQDLR